MIKNILIIRFSSLGDVVISTALIAGVRLKYKDANIYVVTKDGYVDVFKNNPNIKTIFSVGKLGLFDVFRELRKIKFDYIFDIHSNLRSYILGLFLKSNKIIHYKKEVLSRRMLVWFKKKISDFKTTKQKYLDVIFEDSGCVNSKIYLTQDEILNIKKRFFIDDKVRYIGVNTSARWDTKKWVKEYYLEFVDSILKNNEHVKIILLGDKSSFDFNNYILENVSCENRIIDTTAKLNLRELFSVISICRGIFTTDSAIMHIAQSLGVRVAAIFGPTVKEFGFWMPQENDILFEAQLGCRPCSLHGTDICKNKNFLCMKNIVPDFVISEIQNKWKDIL